MTYFVFAKQSLTNMILLTCMVTHLFLSVGNRNVFAKVGVYEYLFEMIFLNILHNWALSLIILCG